MQKPNTPTPESNLNHLSSKEAIIEHLFDKYEGKIALLHYKNAQTPPYLIHIKQPLILLQAGICLKTNGTPAIQDEDFEIINLSPEEIKTLNLSGCTMFLHPVLHDFIPILQPLQMDTDFWEQFGARKQNNTSTGDDALDRIIEGLFADPDDARTLIFPDKSNQLITTDPRQTAIENRRRVDTIMESDTPLPSSPQNPSHYTPSPSSDLTSEDLRAVRISPITKIVTASGIATLLVLAGNYINNNTDSEETIRDDQKLADVISEIKESDLTKTVFDKNRAIAKLLPLTDNQRQLSEEEVENLQAIGAIGQFNAANCSEKFETIIFKQKDPNKRRVRTTCRTTTQEITSDSIQITLTQDGYVAYSPSLGDLNIDNGHNYKTGGHNKLTYDREGHLISFDSYHYLRGTNYITEECTGGINNAGIFNIKCTQHHYDPKTQSQNDIRKTGDSFQQIEISNSHNGELLPKPAFEGCVSVHKSTTQENTARNIGVRGLENDEDIKTHSKILTVEAETKSHPLCFNNENTTPTTPPTPPALPITSKVDK